MIIFPCGLGFLINKNMEEKNITATCYCANSFFFIYSLTKNQHHFIISDIILFLFFFLRMTYTFCIQQLTFVVIISSYHHGNKFIGDVYNKVSHLISVIFTIRYTWQVGLDQCYPTWAINWKEIPCISFIQMQSTCMLISHPEIHCPTQNFL